MVVLNGPLAVTGGVLDLLIAESGIAHTQRAKLGGHGVQKLTLRRTVLLASPARAHRMDSTVWRRYWGARGTSARTRKTPWPRPSPLCLRTFRVGAAVEDGETSSEERGEGNTLTSRSNALSGCGRKRMKANNLQPNASADWPTPTTPANPPHSRDGQSDPQRGQHAGGVCPVSRAVVEHIPCYLSSQGPSMSFSFPTVCQC